MPLLFGREVFRVAVELDHLILAVRDRSRSSDFYGNILGFARENDDGPFSTLRVSPGFVILLAESDAPREEHLAFAMPRDEFESAFERLRTAEVA
jgi:catechol 2,3-dioxygenase-like lactoylglutathione lyase family enzyme